MTAEDEDESDGGIVRSGGVVRRWAVAWWVPVFVLVVAGSWWPFVGAGSAEAWANRFAEAVTNAWVDKLSPVLVLGYLLFGVLTGVVFERRLWRWAMLALPVVVEFGQTWFLWRHGQWADVFLGTAGLALGLQFSSVILDRTFAQRWASSAPMRGMVGWSALCTLLLAGSSWKAWHDGKITGWDPDYPVLLGNEVGGGRPWVGSIHDATLYLLPSSYAHTTVSGGFPVYLVHHGQQQPLEVSGRSVDVTDRLDDNFRAFAERGLERVSVVVTLTPAYNDQSGPARIVTWSNGTSQRNLTLGQDGDAVVLRIRTAGSGDNGIGPGEARWPGVLTAGRQVSLSLWYEHGVAKLMSMKHRSDSEFEPAVFHNRVPMYTPVRVLGGTTWWHGAAFGAVMATALAWLAAFSLAGRLTTIAAVACLVGPLGVMLAARSWGLAGLDHVVGGWVLASALTLASLGVLALRVER